MYDPFAKPEFSPDECAALFDGSRESGVRAARTMKENPDLYRRVRASAVKHGFIGEQPEHWMAEPQRRAEAKAANDKVITQEEISARKEFSQEFVHATLHKDHNAPGKSLSQLVKENGAEWHQRFRIAAKSYGELGPGPGAEIIDRRPKYKQPEPILSSLYQVPDELCDFNGLPRGSRASKAVINELSLKHGYSQLQETQKAIAERSAQLKEYQARVEALKADAVKQDAGAPATPTTDSPEKK